MSAQRIVQSGNFGLNLVDWSPEFIGHMVRW